MNIKKIFKINILVLTFICLLLISSCGGKKPEYVAKKYSYFGYLDTMSYITVQFDKKQISEVDIKYQMSKVDEILLDIERNFSIEQTDMMKSYNIEKSIVMEVNENAGKKDEAGNLIYTTVSEDFMFLLKESIKISEMLNGTFDVTVGPLTRLWDISGQVDLPSEFVSIPTEEQVIETLKLIDYKKILIDEENLKVALPDQNMKLDFGAIAKGYAADKVCEYMRTLNITIALIDLGGNIYSIGESPVTKTKMAVRNPFYSYGGTSPYQLMSAELNEVSFVTSGTYERYVVKDGVTYHHLLNPLTGYPFDNNIMSVSIIGPSSAICDGLATGIYGLGLEAGIEKIKSIDGYMGLFITSDKKVYIVGDVVFIPEDGTTEFEFIYC